MTRDPKHAGEDVSGGRMRAGQPHAHSVKDKALHQGRQFLFMFLYLYVLFGLFTIHESIILREHHIEFTPYGIAVVNALVLAKVMLVAEDFRLGRRFEDGPLIYPILAKSGLFAIVFICFHIVEGVIVGLWHGETLVASVPGMGGGGIKGVISIGIIMFVVLIPFFAFREMHRVLGAAALQTILFKRSHKDIVVEIKSREREF
jgi:hypothetical protein